jgi:aspartyl aminopeptidase
MNYGYSPRNCWDVYTTPQDEKAMEDLAGRYLEFLSRCKTERETVAYARQRLAEAGYSDQGKSGKVMRDLRGKTLFIARRGREPLARGLRVIAAHADAPRLDCKQRPLQEQAGVAQAKTHYYGGIRKYQWLARPLAIHGVVALQDGRVCSLALGEDPADPVFTIADLLPHLAKEQAEKTLARAFEAERLNIVLAHRPLAEKKAGARAAKGEKAADPIKANVLRLLHDRYGLVEEDLYSAELEVVPAGPARFVGLDRALIGGYGQDDRICVFCALEALLDNPRNVPPHTQCLVFWDKEETGSEGSTGAKSHFFAYCAQDLVAAWEPAARLSTVFLATRALSADVHAAMDPDWQELHEKLNSATIGHGPCFCKFTGSRGKYEANDAHPEYVAWLRNVLNKRGIPWQMAELGKVDGGGGGTVAMHLAAYGMDIIDCGPPILGMHSPFELASVADLYATKLAFAAFLKA